MDAPNIVGSGPAVHPPTVAELDVLRRTALREYQPVVEPLSNQELQALARTLAAMARTQQRLLELFGAMATPEVRHER